MKKVLVLLSTYNGEKYLKQQLDSLYNQSGVDIHILVRDDGSSDSTLEILEKYSKTKGEIDIIKGRNLGAAKSFFELAHIAQVEFTPYDYYAFCDQDDVWIKDKLISAVNLLDTKSANKLYFCRANYVDCNTNYLGTAPDIKFFDYTTCVYRNPALGCTMVFDKKLLNNFCLAYSSLDKIHGLHDDWMFKCALFTNAHVLADNNIHIQYRQHGNNVTLAKKNIFQRYKTALKRKLTRKQDYKQDRILFRDIYSKQIEEKCKKEFLEYLITYDNSLRDTLRYLKIQKWKSESLLDRCIWNMMVLLRQF